MYTFFSVLISFPDELITLKSNKMKINCNCLANCDDSNFFVQDSVNMNCFFISTKKLMSDAMFCVIIRIAPTSMSYERYTLLYNVHVQQ